MRSDPLLDGTAVLVVFVLGVGLGVIVGAAGTVSGWQRDAIAHGAAYWAINPTNGQTSFVWK